MHLLESLLFEGRRKGKKRKNKGLVNNGQTVNGDTVLGNVFYMYETHGIALEDLITKLDNVGGYIVDWLDFYNAAVKSGWKKESTIMTIYYALIDSKDREYADIIITKLKQSISGTIQFKGSNSVQFTKRSREATGGDESNRT